MIVGSIRPNFCRIFSDREITSLMYRAVRGWVLDTYRRKHLFFELTVAENIPLSKVRGLPKGELQKKNQLMSELGLSSWQTRRPTRCLVGNVVEQSRSLAIDPNFMLLDEPFSGIDPSQSRN